MPANQEEERRKPGALIATLLRKNLEGVLFPALHRIDLRNWPANLEPASFHQFRGGGFRRDLRHGVPTIHDAFIAGESPEDRRDLPPSAYWPIGGASRLILVHYSLFNCEQRPGSPLFNNSRAAPSLPP